MEETAEAEYKPAISEDRQSELQQHLKINKDFDDGYAEFCLECILFAIEDFKHGDAYRASTLDDYRYIQDKAHDAYHLYDFCKRKNIDGYQAHLWSLYCHLHSLAKSTRDAIPKKRGRGRPAITRMRNELIQKIYECYPNKRGNKSSYGGHFEQTIGKILNWVEPEPPKDLHSVIIRALADLETDFHQSNS